MPVYLLRRWQGTPQALEHAEITWKSLEAMHEMDMIEADAELVEKLQTI
jgi:8-oxo-dGTP diphosphatase